MVGGHFLGKDLQALANACCVERECLAYARGRFVFLEGHNYGHVATVFFSVFAVIQRAWIIHVDNLVYQMGARVTMQICIYLQ